MMGDGWHERRWRVRLIAAAMTIALAGVASADDSLSADALGEILVRKGLITREELRQVQEESKQKESKQTQAAETPRLEAIEAKLPRWLAMLTPFGDLRLRDEGFYQDELHARNRVRFRARLGLTVAPSDEVDRKSTRLNSS